MVGDRYNVMYDIWKPVVGFEGLYEVSNKGQVRSVDREILQKNGRTRKKVGVVLKQFITNKGYPYVMVNKDYKQHLKTVHRLVAEAFIPNPNNYPVVNHKDEDKTNNCVENLEWCTQSHNMTWNDVHKKVAAKLKGKPSHRRMPVIDVNTGIVYCSRSEAAEKLGIRWNNIIDMCNGVKDSINGVKLRNYTEP